MTGEVVSPPSDPVPAEGPGSDEVDYRSYWVWIFVGVALVGIAIVVVALTVQPASSAGLVALVIAATAFPTLALWASRISNAEVVQSTARSAKARNELIGIAIAGLKSDIRSSAEIQTKAVVSAIDQVRDATVKGATDLSREIKSLAETISSVGAAEVKALEEARLAADKQTEATRALRELQVRAEERARPQLHAQTQVRSHWLFFHHNWLVIANTAGPAHGVSVEYRFFQQNDWTRIPVSGFDLETQQQREFDIGDVNATGGSNRLWVNLRYRDDANRQHVATVDMPLGGNQWTQATSRSLD